MVYSRWGHRPCCRARRKRSSCHRGTRGTFLWLHPWRIFFWGVGMSKEVSNVNKWNTGLDYKACTWLRDFLPIFPKIAVRQTVVGRGAAEGNSKPCKPFTTQYILNCKLRHIWVFLDLDFQICISFCFWQMSRFDLILDHWNGKDIEEPLKDPKAATPSGVLRKPNLWSY